MRVQAQPRTILAAVTSCMVASVAAQNAEPCPQDPDVVGYSTIEALRTDMQTELDAIEGGADPSSVYTFFLCPHTVFDMEAEGELTPLLSEAIFACGYSGSSDGNCIFSGGDSQVRFADSSVAGYDVVNVDFLGITFTGFAFASIEAESSNTTNALFKDCIWTDFDGAYAVTNQLSVTTVPTALMIHDSTIEQASATSLFSNQGGSLVVEDTYINQVIVTDVANTGSAGTTVFINTRVSESSAGTIAYTANADSGFLGENVEVFRMDSISTAFMSTGLGSTTFLNQTIVRDNDITDAPFYGVTATLGGYAESRRSRFLRNTGLQAAAQASDSGQVFTARAVFVENRPYTPADVFGSSLSALVLAQVNGTASLRNSVFENNYDYGAHILAYEDSYVEVNNNCIFGGSSDFPVFASEYSGFTAKNFFAEGLEVVLCDTTPAFFFQEDIGSQCFDGGGMDCTGTCEMPDKVTDECTADIYVAPSRSSKSRRSRKSRGRSSSSSSDDNRRSKGGGMGMMRSGKRSGGGMM